MGCINRVAKIALVEVTKDRPYIGNPGLVLFGVAGHPEGLRLAHDFLTGEVNQLELGYDEDELSQVIMASANGAWLWNGKRPIPLITGGKAAIGAGAMAALALMFAGVEAIKAVEITCLVCNGCEGPVQAFSLPGERPVEDQT